MRIFIKHSLIVVSIIFSTVIFFQSQPAMAAVCKINEFKDNPADYVSKQNGQYIQRIIPCIEEPIHDASIKMLQKISDYLKDIATIMGGLAIVFFGIQVIGGEMEIGDAASVLLRVGLVVLFSYNLGNFAESLYDILRQLLEMVTGGDKYSPWKDLDDAIGKIIGFAKANKDDDGVKTGIFALLDGSLNDKVFGLLIFVVGIMTLFAVMTFIFEATYIYLEAFMGIAFLIIISPLIIPLAFFKLGDNYVRTWLNLLIVTILTPVMMFGFLWMFIDIFKDSVDAIFAILQSDYVAKYLHSNQPLPHQTLTTDFTVACDEIVQHVGKTGCTQDQIIASSRNSLDAQSFSNSPFNISILELNGMNGKTDLENKKSLFFALFNVWFFTTIMKLMLGKVPEVVSSIGGVSSIFSNDGLMHSPLSKLTRRFA